MIITKKAKKFLRRILKILGQPEMLILPGQLAFFLLLAIVPTFTIIAYVASFFNVSIDFASSFSKYIVAEAFSVVFSRYALPCSVSRT